MKIKSNSKCTAKKCASSKNTAKATSKTVKSVTFTVHAERGQTVCIAGDFNGWDPTAKKMTYKARGGVYTTTVKLTPGEHQYKFVINGTWCADPENANAVANDQGTFNSVVFVK